MSSVTLKHQNASKNLIVDWSWIPQSEILLCRLREQCLANESYVFEAEYTSELSRDMAGFYLSQYNVTDESTGEIFTHYIAATHMQVIQEGESISLPLALYLMLPSQPWLGQYFSVLMNQHSRQNLTFRLLMIQVSLSFDRMVSCLTEVGLCYKPMVVCCLVLKKRHPCQLTSLPLLSLISNVCRV